MDSVWIHYGFTMDSLWTHYEQNTNKSALFYSKKCPISNPSFRGFNNRDKKKRRSKKLDRLFFEMYRYYSSSFNVLSSNCNWLAFKRFWFWK